MSEMLDKQITKLKTQAKFLGVKLQLDIAKDGVVMIYPKHRKDVAGSMGHLVSGDKVNIMAYFIDLKRLDWARMEGFSEEQLREDNENLRIFKEVRPDVLINYLV